MTCEFLSGLTQLTLSASDIVIGTGGITSAGSLYFFLTARNRAGWTIASSPLQITYPALSSITVTLPAAARGLGTDFLRYSLTANTTPDPIASYQLAEWENYDADQYTRRTLNPIALTNNEHIAPSPSVAIPADLPTGSDLINGQHRLIIGGLPNGATSSYYKYSQYSTAPANLEFIIEPYPGEKWVRVANPYTAQITNPYGTGGCASDVRSIDSNYIISPPPYNPVQPSPVKGTPIKLTWRNDSLIVLKAGTNFGLNVRQGAEDRTDAFNGKMILTLKGYTDGFGGLDRFDAGGVNAMPNVDIDRVWGYTDDAIGILTIDKDLPPSESVVYEIAPYFTSQQFQGHLAANELISTYLYPYTQSGKNVASLWAITGDLVLPVAERMHVVTLLGAGIKVNSGSAIVKGYTFTQVPDQNIYGLTPDTSNQQICLDGNGICANRTAPIGSEAIRAIVSTESGTSKVGTLSDSISIAANGKATLTLTYPNYAGGSECGIRSDYPVIGGDLGEFNPNFVRIFAKSGTDYYPALSSGNSDIGIVPDFTQAIVVDSLGSAISMPTDPADPLFGLFTPPTITAAATTSGSIPAGNYQFFAAYYYDGSTVSKISHTDPTVIRESELTIADLFLLNQGWGRPIYQLADLRLIDRSDTFAWQQRPVAGGSIFYYDPDSLAVDDGIAVFKPDYLQASTAGRWLIRKSFSITPAGIWNDTSTYKYLDQVTVSDDGSYLYVNPGSSSGYPLTDPNYWQQTSFRGSQGIQGNPGTTGATTVGTNPNLPAFNANATYEVDSTTNLSVGQYYAFNGITGTLLATALPTSTTVTLQNIDATVSSAIYSGTKLLATGKTGDTGQTGATGTVGATTSGTNPVTPALNATATYTVTSTTGLAIGQYYKFGGITGVFLATSLPTSTTVTLQNIDATVGATVAGSTKIDLSGLKGAIGASGSPHVSRGDYSAGATYSQYDEISYNGSSYWWANTTVGNTAPPSTDWQLIASIGTPGLAGAGDMSKAIYDVDNNGIVDNSAKLNAQLPGYYLDRTNHTGTQPAATIADFAEAVDDRANALLVMGAGMTKVYDDSSGTLTLSSTTGGAVTAWTDISTSNYDVPAAGGKFSIAATSDTIVKLPLTPVANTEVTYQIVDTTVNNVYLQPQAPDTIATQLVNFQGKHNPTIDRHLIETLRYVSGRWLPYFGRLIYEAFVATSLDPFNANTVFFAMFEGANNSTSFTDTKGNAISIRSGTPKISTAQSMFGSGSLYLDGSSSLSIPAVPNFASGTDDFDWEIAICPTAFTTGKVQGLIDFRASTTGSPEVIRIDNQTNAGTIEHFSNASNFGLSTLKLDRWQILRVSRYQGIKTIYLDDIPIYSGVDTTNYTYTGGLTIGDIVDTAAPYDGMFTGYIQYIRKTVTVSRSQGYSTDALTFLKPTATDADPLDAFKVLDINCDSGSIVDVKSHVITPTGAVAVSTAQKRAGSSSIALTGGHLDVSGGTDFNFGLAPYSVHLSVYMSTVSGNQYFSDFDSGNASSLSSIGTDFRTAIGGALDSTFSQVVLASKWYDLALARIDTKLLLIRDQQIVAASNNVPAAVNYSTMRIGAYRGGGIVTQGFLDSASVYKGIANGSNLTHAYPLRFLARFSGGSPNDELGAVGTIVGTAPTYDTANKRSLEASALFAGTGYISYPAIPAYDLDAGGFEIAGWIKASTTPNSVSCLVSSGTASGISDSQTWGVYSNFDVVSLSGRTNVNKLSFWVGAISINNSILSSTTSFNDGLPHYWRIIKYVIGATAATILIVDGKIEDVYLGAYTIAATTRGLLVGNILNVAGRNFKGNADDIAIYKN